MRTTDIQQGSSKAPEQYHITILAHGPYLVYGHPPLDQQFIMPDADGISWEFRKGRAFQMAEPAALCRCGGSRKKPYCDGSHTTTDWDSTLTAPEEPLLSGAEVFEGPVISLTDNEKYCVFARFCDAKGRVWNLVGQSDNPAARELTVREADMCPGGRLSGWDNATRQPFEPHYDPSLALENPRHDKDNFSINHSNRFIMEIKNIKESGGGYFMAEHNGEEAGRMTYSNAGEDKFIIDHTEVRPEYADHGVGRSMVMAAVQYARDNNLKIIPLCSFAKSVFVKDDTIRDVLYS